MPVRWGHALSDRARAHFYSDGVRIVVLLLTLNGQVKALGIPSGHASAPMILHHFRGRLRAGSGIIEGLLADMKTTSFQPRSGLWRLNYSTIVSPFSYRSHTAPLPPPLHTSKNPSPVHTHALVLPGVYRYSRAFGVFPVLLAAAGAGRKLIYRQNKLKCSSSSRSSIRAL